MLPISHVPLSIFLAFFSFFFAKKLFLLFAIIFICELCNDWKISVEKILICWPMRSGVVLSHKNISILLNSFTGPLGFLTFIFEFRPNRESHHPLSTFFCTAILYGEWHIVYIPQELSSALLVCRSLLLEFDVNSRELEAHRNRSSANRTIESFENSLRYKSRALAPTLVTSQRLLFCFPRSAPSIHKVIFP